jgi:hypothetical protein
LKKRILFEDAADSVFLNVLFESHHERIFVEEVPDDNKPSFAVARGYHFSSKPLVRLIPPFPRFGGRQILHVVSDYKIRPVLVMP